MTSLDVAPDSEARAAARRRLDGLAKPLGALGRLEDLAVWLAGVQGTEFPTAPGSVAVVLFAGDHGVTSGSGAVSARTPGK
jgi:nicotinate-nucleotide--dimethylbenzimidazole phosphoribosyltransferase